MQKVDLTAVLAEAGGSTRKRPQPIEQSETNKPPKAVKTAPKKAQPSRAGTRPITAHFPKNVRDQLKILAIEQDTTLQDLIAEAFNDLFAKYGKAEIAPLTNPH